VHLGDIGARLRAQHLAADIGERRDAAAAVGAELTIVFRLDLALVDFLDIAARPDPRAAQLVEAGVDVDQGLGIGIGAGRVIDADRGLAALELDFAHRDADAGSAVRRDMDFFRAADRAGGYANFGFCGEVSHFSFLCHFGTRAEFCRNPLPPSARVIGIRFSGSQGVTPASQSNDSPGMGPC